MVKRTAFITPRLALLILLGADVARAQFEVPPIPGWTDLRSGAAPPASISPELLADARSDKYTAFAVHFRERATFNANFNVVVADGVAPINEEFARQAADQVIRQLGGKLVSSKVISSRAGFRARIEREATFGGVPARQVQYWIPGDSKMAVVTYTFARADDERYRRTVEDHALRIVPESASPQLLLWRGTQTGDIGMMREALAAGADVNEEAFLSTPLGVAARNGRIGAADFLLKNGARIDQRYGLPGRTALQEAALGGQLEMLRFLVEAGADVNATNKHGRTALYYAESPTPPLQPPPNSRVIAEYLRSKGGIRGIEAQAAKPVLPGKLWKSPDDRFAAAFPEPPERIDVAASGGAGVGYRTIVETPAGFAQYLVSVTRLDAMRTRPPEKQVREILEMSTTAFVSSVGGDQADLKTSWATFGKGFPRLDHEVRYMREGVRFETIGFFTMLGTDMFRVGVTYPELTAEARRGPARAFLQSFVTFSVSTAPDSEQYSSAIVRTAGGVPFACPSELENGARGAVEKNGGKHLGARCFHFKDDPSGVATRIDDVRNAQKHQGKAGEWKPMQAGGGIRQAERYDDDGILWVVFRATPRGTGRFPAEGGAALLVQIVR